MASRPSQQSRSSSGGGPRASLPRMIFSPFARILRRLLPIGVPTTIPTSPTHLLTPFVLALTAALQRLDLSRDPRRTLDKLSKYRYTTANTLPLVYLLTCSLYSLFIMSSSLLVIKVGIPLVWTAVLLIPLTSQFVWPATPILVWVLTFFSARFIPSSHRPHIHVALLPALESVLYGANISDIQTRYTNAFLDVLAWLPYGVIHFGMPFIVALLLWVLGPKGSVQFWGKAFGWMNLIGVCTQVIFPCAAPWYEIIHGLTPANYSMPGSPGGLLRIDRVFHSSGYTNAFGSAPLVFGAFPSLHSGSAVMEALFMSHFFPHLRPLYWTYVGVLWWATMYLSHHYLIDLTGGACLSVVVFYALMPEAYKDADQIEWTRALPREEGYAMVNGITRGGEVDLDEEIRKLEETEGQVEEGGDEESKIEGGEAEMGSGGLEPPKLRNKRTVSWGETKILGEDRMGQQAVEGRQGEGART